MKLLFQVASCAALTCSLAAYAQEIAETPAPASSLPQQMVRTQLAISAAYAEVISAVAERKSSPENAAQTIAELCAMKAELEKRIAEMSDADKAEYEHMLESGSMGKSLKQLRTALDQLEGALKYAKYYDSAELKAACEAFNQ